MSVSVHRHRSQNIAGQMQAGTVVYFCLCTTKVQIRSLVQIQAEKLQLINPVASLVKCPPVAAHSVRQPRRSTTKSTKTNQYSQKRNCVVRAPRTTVSGTHTHIHAAVARSTIGHLDLSHRALGTSTWHERRTGGHPL